MIAPATGQSVEVVWEDCFSVDKWTSFDELAEKMPPPIVTLGSYRGSITGLSGIFWILCSGVQADDDGEPHYGGGTWFIPSAAIVGWKALL